MVLHVERQSDCGEKKALFFQESFREHILVPLHAGGGFEQERGQ